MMLLFIGTEAKTVFLDILHYKLIEATSEADLKGPAQV